MSSADLSLIDAPAVAVHEPAPAGRPVKAQTDADVAQAATAAPDRPRQHHLPRGFARSRFHGLVFPIAVIVGITLSVLLWLHADEAKLSAPTPEVSAPPAPTPTPTPTPRAVSTTLPVANEVPHESSPIAKAEAPGAAAQRPTHTRRPTLPAATPPEPKPTVAALPRAEPAEQAVDAPTHAAYEALLAGDLATASEHYRQALAGNGQNCDALNGLGLIALRKDHLAEATHWFERCAAADPRNPYARAALARLGLESTLAGGEIALQEMLRRTPADPALHFALANGMARNGQWDKAQEHYFQASALDPGNPDYLFNLAVALDRLGYPGPAREHYGQALAAARLRPAAFDPVAATARREQLAEAPR
ncbi:tetratricopeptide repeat protein [Niveibacterium sp. SC-1]|uniref:tetratricopeptide repeat protein n=1 Tax=Niveibacterium sp. SC-1 TaxID=3135646 RepID=UPI00311EA60C